MANALALARGLVLLDISRRLLSCSSFGSLLGAPPELRECMYTLGTGVIRGDPNANGVYSMHAMSRAYLWLGT